jgi:type IX secretion system substrate protein
MRFITFVTIFILSSIAIGFADDIESMIEEGEEKNQLREQWLNEMNRTEPGVDWRILEDEARKSKQTIRMQKFKNLIENGKDIKILSAVETFADGLLKGNWNEKGSDNQSGRVLTADIDFENNLIYALSAGGNVWKGTIEGENWEILNNSMKFTGSLIRVFDIQDTRRVFVVSSRTCWYTDNEGQTWEESEGFENQKKWGGFVKAAVLNDGKETIYIISNEWNYDDWGTEHNLYISRDHGKNFEKIKTWQDFSSVHEIWAPRYDDDKAYLIHQDTIFTLTSEPAFDNFTVATKGLSAGDIEEIQNISFCGSVQDGNPVLTMAARIKNEKLTIILRSFDGGMKWSYDGEIEQTLFNRRNSYKTGLDDPEKIYFGSVEVFKSSDAGSEFVVQNKWGHYYGDPENLLHADIPAIDLFRSPDGVEVALVSTDGGLYISWDKLETTKNLSMKGLNISQYYDVLTSTNDANYIFAGAQDQGFQRCVEDNGGVCSFEQTISGDYGQFTSSDGGSTLWCCYPGFAMLYTNAEATMNRFSWNFRDYSNKIWIPQIVADPKNPSSAYIAAGGEGGEANLWYLTYSNSQITHQKLPFNFKTLGDNAILTAIGVSIFDENVLYALTNNGKFAYSDSKGENWTLREDFEGLTGHYFYGQKILPSKVNLGELFIGGSGQNSAGCFHSDDNGVTFTPLEGLPNVLIYDMAMDKDEHMLFVATAVGPYVYIRTQAKWYDLTGLAAPDQTYWAVEYLDDVNTVRFATYGRGIWDLELTEISPLVTGETGIDDNNSDTAQQFIKVNPNPIGDFANITVNLVTSSFAEINLYDIEGRIVRNVFKGELGSGSIDLDWNLNESGSRQLTAGVYILTLSAEGNSSYTKVVID